ncbi:DMT family transporter [Rugosimonospora africana]|uniref:Transporter family-2 protein n=1 Tax=Rugosimonospora africana TaxID=556532 RepID=A0A8J3VN78_9ACTN|nr:DMT family transporter [Rugosimonospora africana]GIH12670.1 hypothetical protein Raf01_08420 [Rugosimonospora africana]
MHRLRSFFSRFGRRPGRRAAACGTAAIGGAAQAVQSRLNGELGARLHDGLATAGITFGLGLLLVGVLVGTRRRGRRSLAQVVQAARTGRLRGWQCLGGLGGALLVTAQSITVAELGVAVFSVSAVAGQSVSSLVADRVGAGPSGRQRLTVTRVAGAALAITAVLVALGGRLRGHAVLGPALLSAVAGLSIAWQQGFNGRVRAASDSALVATAVNFAVGTVALLLAVGVDIGLRGPPSGTPPSEPWLYVGGIIGVFYIGVGAAVVQYTGVLLLGLSLTAGQLTSALVLDLIAPTPGSKVGLNLLVGIALTLLAVALALVHVHLPRHRRHDAGAGR